MVRLDFNENTIGYPEAYPPGMPTDWVMAYPEYQEFIARLAQLWQVSPGELLLTNGSDEGLSVIASTFIEPGQDAAVISKPTFSMIPHYLQLAGARLVEVPVTRTLEFDLPAIEAALAQRPKLALFASPDNPTGARLSGEQVASWCQRFPNTLFAIDEAYVEYAGESVLPLIHRFENLLVTRTFSKAWGLAGLRLGVILGNPVLIEALNKVRSPYSVNTAAVWAADKLLDRTEQVWADAQAAMQRKARLMAGIRDRGYQVMPGHANFFLLAAGIDAARLSAFCQAHGVLIRNRSPQTLPCDHPLWGMIRVSVGSDTENQRLLDCLDAFRQRHGLLFDMDDTLVDTSKSFDVTVAELVKQFAPGQPLAEGELTALRMEGGFNDDWDATVELLKRRGISIPRDQIAEAGQTIYFALAPQNETLMLDTALLTQLAKRYRLFIVTGRFRNEYEPIWAKTLDPLFERVYCRDDLNGHRPKPAPDPLLAVLKAHQLESGFYVGNSVDDMQAAIGAKLTALAVAHTQTAPVLAEAGAHHTLEHITNLGKVFSL
jgi:histidinol-phosphate aminotransferase